MLAQSSRPSLARSKTRWQHDAWNRTKLRVRNTRKGFGLRRLFDHLVGERDELCGNGYTECFGGFGIDHQLEFGRLPYWQVGRLGAFEDLTDIAAGSVISTCEAVAVTHETTVRDVPSARINRRDRMASGARDDLLSPID